LDAEATCQSSAIASSGKVEFAAGETNPTFFERVFVILCCDAELVPVVASLAQQAHNAS
jgi:hypothetical protein